MFIIDNQTSKFVRVSEKDISLPYSTKVNCTPDLAVEILRLRNKNNRFLSRRWEKIRRDIESGNWHVTGDPIKFTRNGELLDGQHRLKAIAESGKTTPIMFAFGVDDESKPVIDDGARRSDFDIARLSGLPYSAKAIAAANYLMESKNVEASRQEKVEFYNRHGQALEWIDGVLKEYSNPKNIGNPVLAAVLRAYYTQDLERLKLFIKILSNGIPEDRRTDLAACNFRDYLNDTKMENTGPARLEKYFKAIYALDRFLKGENYTRLYKSKNHLYSLPEEDTVLCSACVK